MAEYDVKEPRIQELIKKLVYADGATDKGDTAERLMEAYADIMVLVLEILGEETEAGLDDLRDKIEELEEKNSILEDEVKHSDKTNENMRGEITDLENQVLELKEKHE